MIEIPEAAALAGQINDHLKNQKIISAKAAQSPHKFAWYQGNPESYTAMLVGKTILNAYPLGGTLEILVDDVSIALSEGAFPAFYGKEDKRPDKHQLLLELADGSALAVSVQMYGGILCFYDGGCDNPYYLLAKSKPSPLTDSADHAWFETILKAPGVGKLSLKALLATEQRIPGLGNGSLQDVLFNAGLHPKKVVSTLSDGDIEILFNSIKSTLQQMAVKRGRDTERDLFGKPGGYVTRCSRLTVGKPCGNCAAPIQKAAYMGGAVYFCPNCQK